MAKPQAFEFLLSCSYSSCPGSDWSAWVGFRPLKKGFSIWAGGSNTEGDGPTRRRIGRSKEILDWRTASRALLNASDGSIFGDFRSDIEVSGASVLEAEVLALCWMSEDEIQTDVKEFLVGLSDEDLEWLGKVLKGSLTSDKSLELIGEYLEYVECSPRVKWFEYFPKRKIGNLSTLVERMEKDKEDRLDLERKTLADSLAPFLESIESIVSAKSEAIGPTVTWEDGVVKRGHLSALESMLRDYAVGNCRIPDVVELNNIWEEIKKQPVPVGKWGKTLYYLNTDKL